MDEVREHCLPALAVSLDDKEYLESLGLFQMIVL